MKGNIGKCSVNFEYVVKFTKDERIVLKDLHGTHSFELNRDVIKKHFIHSYCRRTQRRTRRNSLGQVPYKEGRKLEKQDLQHNRPLTENFVTPAWLKAQFGKVCHDCGDCFRFDIKGKVVERKPNSRPDRQRRVPSREQHRATMCDLPPAKKLLVKESLPEGKCFSPSFV